MGNVIKEFKPDIKLKNKLRVQRQRTTGKYKVIRRIIDILFTLTISIPIMFLIFAYCSDKFVYLNSMYAPIGSKNNLFIWTVTVCIFVIFGFITMAFKALLSNLVRSDNDNRIAESLIYNNGILEYGYKVYMQSTYNDRVIVKIPLDTIEKISYIEKLKQIKIYGLISSVYYDNYEEGITRGEEKYLKETFAFFDYFSPSLLDFLKNNNIKIFDEKERK